MIRRSGIMAKVVRRALVVVVVAGSRSPRLILELMPGTFRAEIWSVRARNWKVWCRMIELNGKIYIMIEQVMRALPDTIYIYALFLPDLYSTCVYVVGYLHERLFVRLRQIKRHILRTCNEKPPFRARSLYARRIKGTRGFSETFNRPMTSTSSLELITQINASAAPLKVRASCV